MRLPAVTIAAAFASGILFGLSRLFFRHSSDQATLLIVLCACAALLVAGLVLAWGSLIWCGSASSLLCWMTLGILAALLAQQQLPPEHIVNRLQAQQIPLHTPLRWHGVLRGEPARLPWGHGFEIDLTGVDAATGYLPLNGGMRIGFTPHENDPDLPELHAGDEISLFAEGRLPLTYNDPGAFDRREFLAQQDIHLLATLCASRLLEKAGTARRTWRSRLARLRGNLRGRLGAMFPASPESVAILSAMLLGDRSFIDRAESVDYQKTGTFHVLVVAGLHIGALAFFLHWLLRKLRLRRVAGALLMLAALFAYVMVVEQRAPVLRADMLIRIMWGDSPLFCRISRSLDSSWEEKMLPQLSDS